MVCRTVCPVAVLYVMLRMNNTHVEVLKQECRNPGHLPSPS